MSCRMLFRVTSAVALAVLTACSAPVKQLPDNSEIQEHLGDHHDSAVTRDLLRELAASAPGTSAFTYGRLHALEELAGEESRRKFFGAWSSSPPEPLRWK